MVTRAREALPVGFSVTAAGTGVAAKNSTPITGAALSALSQVSFSINSEGGPVTAEPTLWVPIDVHQGQDSNSPLTVRV